LFDQNNCQILCLLVSWIISSIGELFWQKFEKVGAIFDCFLEICLKT
jgi:hypothetical protein